MAFPAISIIMPVYNAESYLSQAIESILLQTFRDFEFIIINDGSTDSSSQIVEMVSDTRIRYYQNDGNQGIVFTLNRGLSLALGKYIARMDADDIALPSRLAKQFVFMENHPSVGLLGANTILIDEQGKLLQDGRTSFSTHPFERLPAVLRWNLLWGAGVSHPTVMFRRQLLIDKDLTYCSDFSCTEDYDLWTRIATHSDITYLPEALLFYRINSAGISNTSRQRQQRQVLKITQREISNLLGEDIDYDSLEALHVFIFRGEADPKYDYVSAVAYLTQIYQAFLSRHSLTNADERALRHKISATIVALARCARMHSHLAGIRILWHYFVRYPAEFPRQALAKLRPGPK